MLGDPGWAGVGGVGGVGGWVSPAPLCRGQTGGYYGRGVLRQSYYTAQMFCAIG